jgi:hypothetical protein
LGKGDEMKGESEEASIRSQIDELKSGSVKPADIEAIVDRIGKMAHDPEAAHALEDDLRAEVLRVISDRRTLYPAACADAALATECFGFARWCA